MVCNLYEFSTQVEFQEHASAVLKKSENQYELTWAGIEVGPGSLTGEGSLSRSTLHQVHQGYC